MPAIWMTAKYDADNPKALRELVAGGTKLLPFSQPIMEASFAAANEVYAETTAKNPKFKKIYDSMVAFRKEEVLWFRVVENTFDNFMARQSAAGRSDTLAFDDRRENPASAGFSVRFQHARLFAKLQAAMPVSGRSRGQGVFRQTAGGN